MNHNYVVKVVENGHPGLNLSYLANRLVKYLNGKSEKASPPIKGEDGTKYTLRTGLNVTVRPRTNAGPLEMEVEGSIDAFQRSVAALRRIYPGDVEVEYLT